MIDSPIYCITSDIDWASDYCIDDFLRLTRSLGVTPTLFATHESRVIRDFESAHPRHVGVHPNFLPHSSHGADYLSVIEHVLRLYPGAETFRSHCFFDHTHILREMSRRGMRYDSNLCLYLQPHITPLRLGSPGLTRLPVFWEDDVHWQQTGGDWRLERYVDEFASPGLKIINVHPFIIAANIPTEDHYVRVKKHITTLSDRDAAAVRYDGPGPRTFLTGLVQHLRSRGCQILALHEVYESLPVQTFLGSLHRCGS